MLYFFHACRSLRVVVFAAGLCALNLAAVSRAGAAETPVPQSSPESPSLASSAATTPGLENAEWRLRTLHGRPVSPDAPTLHFDAANKRASGFAGVNRYFGSYESGAGGKLSFGALGSTRMAGPPAAMKLEAEFLAMLGSADGMRLASDGRTLDLLKNGAVVAHFEAASATGK